VDRVELVDLVDLVDLVQRGPVFARVNDSSLVTLAPLQLSVR